MPTLGNWRERDWWTPATAMGVLLVTLLSGALLILQSRRGAVRRLPLEQPGATLTGRGPP